MENQNSKNNGAVQAIAHTFSKSGDTPNGVEEMGLLKLFHTPIEHELYRVMRAETIAVKSRIGVFSARGLMVLTGLNGCSAVRRGLAGLQSKLSIERRKVEGETADNHSASVYYVYSPEEIFTRRSEAGLTMYPKEVLAYEDKRAFSRAIEELIDRYDLTRREAQVAICCSEGLTNSQIGERLYIGGETVKSHLRNIFVKCGVSRRTELISILLTQNAREYAGSRV